MYATLDFTLPCPDITHWRAGNTGTEGVWHFDSGKPGRHVMLSALVHGNEICGAWALKGLLEAGVRTSNGTLTLAFCNLAAFDRFDSTNHDASRFVDQDMNRQWSVERLQDASTQERRRGAALRPFIERAEWLLDLHSMHERGAPLLLTGPHARNVELAKELRAPMHIVVDTGHADGVRMRDFGQFGQPDGNACNIRSLLIECGFHGDESSRLVAQDQCVRFLAASGVVDKALLLDLLPSWFLPDAPRQLALYVEGAVVAKSEHFKFVEGLEDLQLFPKAGTLVGDNDGEPVVTPFENCVLVMPSTRQARKGVTVVRFAKQQVL